MFKQFLTAIFFSVLMPGVIVGLAQIKLVEPASVFSPPEAADVPPSSAVSFLDFSSPSSCRPASAPRGSVFELRMKNEELRIHENETPDSRVNDCKSGGAAFIAPSGFAYPDEIDVIAEAAATNGVATAADWRILLAIRMAENGRDGRQFGVLHPRAVDTDLRTQAGWAAATLVANRRRWNEECRIENVEFIEFLAERYCPAACDPEGHENWKRNVGFFYNRFRGQDSENEI